MGKHQDEMSEIINGHISSTTKCNSERTVEKSNEHPEWLPDGWNVDFRTRKSGANMGSGYKCYIDPSGHKFYSKPEVLRYIETVNNNTHTSKKEKICKSNDAVEKFKEDLPPGQITEGKDVVEKSPVEDLPPGWITEAKFRKGGSGNKKDMLYIDPVSGYVFRSKKDALRYLNSGDISTCVLKPYKRHIQDEDKIMDVVEKSPVDDLPPEWITEAKVRKGGTGNKKDVLYIDPVSGYVFRSKKDALRYLNSGDISTCVLKPYKRHIQDEDKITPSSTGKKLKLNQSATRQQLFSDVTDSSGMMAAPIPPGEPVVKNQPSKNAAALTPEIKKTSDPDDVQEKNYVVNMLGQASKRNHSNHSLSKTKESNVARRFSRRLSGDEPDQLTNELMSNSISDKKAPIYKSRKSKGEINATLRQSDGRPAMELADHASINGETSNKGRKLPEITPITSNQLKKFDEEMNNDEKSEPEQSLAFHYSWSDPCLEFAIQTLTGALSAEDSVSNGPVRIFENDMSPKNKLVENVTGINSDKNSRVNSKKPKKNIELTMPRRLSKRLAGQEPEVLPTEKAIEYATRKSCNDEPDATVIITNGMSGHLHAREETKLVVSASDRLKMLCGESSSKSEKSYDAQTVPNEQVQRLEAENVGDDKSDPQFPSPFGDSWSDPCLDFAIKTLTGDLPVDTPAADIFPVITFDINDPPIEELLDSVEQQSINEEARDNPNQSQTKTEFNSVSQPPKQLLNQPELMTHQTSCGNDLKLATRESYKVENSITENFIESGSQRMEAGKARQMIDINKIILEEEPSEETQVLECESVTEKPQPETAINHDNSERAFSFSFMDSWSDPCLDFAFKTLSGTIPAEENIAIRGRFQEPVNRHDQRGGGSTVLDFGFSSISHSGISFHNDMGEKSRPGQQSSTSSTFLPQEKPDLHGFSRVPPQEQYFGYSNNFQRR